MENWKMEIEPRVYRMTMAEMRKQILLLIGQTKWPGDQTILIMLLNSYAGSFQRNDINCLFYVRFRYGDWTHRDLLVAVYKAFIYHGLVYQYINGSKKADSYAKSGR